MKTLKAIWKCFIEMIKDFHQKGFAIFKKPVKDFSDTMRSLERQAEVEAKRKARGGKKRKHFGKMFHNPLFEGTYRRKSRKIGRNEPCPCGSNLKSKKCCLA